MAVYRFDVGNYRYTFALTTDFKGKNTVMATFSKKEGGIYITVARACMISAIMTFQLYPGSDEEGNPTVTFLAYNAKMYSISYSALSSKFGLVLKNLSHVYTYTHGYNGVKNAVIQAMSPQVTLYIHSHNPKSKPTDEYYRMSGFIEAESVENISCGDLSVQKTATSIIVTTQCPRKITHIEQSFRFCMFIGPSGIVLVKLEEDATLNLYWFANGIDLIGFLRGYEIVRPIEYNVIVVPSNGLTPFACCTINGEHIAVNELTGMHRGYLHRYIEKLALDANRPVADLYSIEHVDEILPLNVKMVNAYVINNLAITPFDGNIIYSGWQIDMLPKIPLKFLRLSAKYFTMGTYSQIFVGVIEESYNVIDFAICIFSQSEDLANDCDLNVHKLNPGEVTPFFTNHGKLHRVLSNGQVVPFTFDNMPLSQSPGKLIIDRNSLLCHHPDGYSNANKVPVSDFTAPDQEPGRSMMCYACRGSGQIITVSALYSQGENRKSTVINAQHGAHRLKLTADRAIDVRIFGNYVIVYSAGHRISVWKLTPNFANFIDIINSINTNAIAPDYTFVGSQVSISSHILFTCPIASNSQHFRLNLNDDAPEVKILTDIKIMNIFKEFNIDPNDVYYYLSDNNAVLNISTTKVIHTNSVKVPGCPYFMSAFRL